ncbi:hypothetical protein XENORESO_005956 [Xenotaenia resolanae]|uniref:Uncharacterized protein n=1 Tax=Xenotaenia resolanae TaxID=208358 RepID=A0ABV0WHI2_9TELE
MLLQNPEKEYQLGVITWTRRNHRYKEHHRSTRQGKNSLKENKSTFQERLRTSAPSVKTSPRFENSQTQKPVSDCAFLFDSNTNFCISTKRKNTIANTDN